MTKYKDDNDNTITKNFYNFEANKLDVSTINYIKNEQSNNLIDIKKFMANELLELLRNKINSLELLENTGYPSELIMNIILRYDSYSGLDILSCIYALEADEKNMNSYLDEKGPQKKKV